MASEDRVNILVVDDLPDKLLAMELVLEDLGQNVISVRSGREALRKLLEYEFAVVLLDVNMPDMDGFETATLIRQRKRSQHTPIIFITAFSDELHTARGYSLGAVDYILSPVVPEILRTKVSVFVDLHRKSEQVKRQAEERVVLAREQVARAAAEESTRRSLFLAEASKTLVRSLDYEATIRSLASLPVPFLADLSAVTIVQRSGDSYLTELAWQGQDDPVCAETTTPGTLAQAELAAAIEGALVTGRAALLAVLPREASDEKSQTSDFPLAPPEMKARSAMVLPLHARGRTLGVLTLAILYSDRQYGEADLALGEDLASRAALAIDNARLYHDIQEDDRRKNEFLAMLAHELRNPLAPIRNAVQILRSFGPQNNDLEWARDVIERQVQQLVRLVDDLLDVSRITRGKVTLRTQRIDVATVVVRAVETSQPLIDARKQILSITAPPEPVMVQGDPDRLAQVLANLLNNAAKYTEEGGRIWLTVACEDDQVVFRVRDTGIGIPADMLNSVFDLFTQVNRALDRSQGGLGIGLTLVRRLVEMHGGTVHATSAGLNLGSEFVVSLPILCDQPEPVVRRNGVHHSLSDRSLCRVLIVDDNRDGAESLAMLLRVSGHEVTVAHDGPSALSEARTFQPDLILLDIGLPGMSGYEVALRFREEPGFDKVQLIALTGYGQEEDRQRSREAGFQHHLVKPVDPEVLMHLLDQVPCQA